MQSAEVRVLQNFDYTLAINQRHIKLHIRKTAARFSPNKFFGGQSDTRKLLRRQVRCSLGMGAALFHLNEDHPVAIAHDQVDLTRSAAPTAGREDVPCPCIVQSDRFFGCKPGVIGNRAAQAFCPKERPI